MSQHIHSSVLYHECREALAIGSEGIYIDATFGRGGHSRGILNALNTSGQLIAFDRDPRAIEYARHHFSEPNFFAYAREGVQAFYEFNKKHLQDVLHFEVPVKEEFIGEALTRLDGTLLSFRAESKEELLA